MKIAMLTYSVKPRGGVVHAIEVSEALQRRGHDVELMALARPGEALFRQHDGPGQARPPHAARRARSTCASRRCSRPTPKGLRPLLGGHDIVHAQDCLSANAALQLRDEGVIDHVVRTVHHVDDFTSPSLIECQERSIVGPDHVLCVSAPWVQRLRDEFGVEAGIVPNGVDTHRFRPPHDDAERADARRRAGVEDRLDGAHRRRRRAAQGQHDPARGLRAAARDPPVPRPDPADRRRLARCSTTATRSTASTRASHELDLTRHVKRLGALEPDEIERLFRAADVFAFP